MSQNNHDATSNTPKSAYLFIKVLPFTEINVEPPLTLPNNRPIEPRLCSSANLQPSQPPYQAEQDEPDDSVSSLHSANNARERDSIITGQCRGASVLLAFDEAWEKAARTTHQ